MEPRTTAGKGQQQFSMQAATQKEKSFMTPTIMWQWNMVMSPTGLATKNYCAGEGQQQFTRQKGEGCVWVCVEERTS
jgi:hypothetical protein